VSPRASKAGFASVSAAIAPWSLIGRFDGLTIYEYRCRARAEDEPFKERHVHTGFALVQSGTFVYRRGRDVQPLIPGALLLGNAGDEYVCSHENGTGDVCLSFAWSPERIDDVKRSRSLGAFTRSMLPPVPRITALSRLALAAAEFMETHAEQPLDLATVARCVQISPFHFLRLFRRELGLTPHQHLIRVRIRRAIERLAETDRPITDIALDVGFEDLSNFVRTFHRHVGCPPSAYRSKILQVGRRAQR
jgi:AraC family transcriptional regulator